MSQIRVLPESVVSQIAAGEVVDRPASVVRELMDNSIDAGAHRVIVRMEAGGKRLVRVHDDGAGMDQDDLLLCIERHATSKIESVGDLFAIRTLGFRGEALPSISAVSKLEIVSRPAHLLVGYRLRMAGGKLLSIEETGAPPGTLVNVADLFYNVPARRKFLKGTRAEGDAISDVFCRIALPHTEVHFRLEEGERTLVDLPESQNIRGRLADVMGRETAEAMIELEERRGGLDLKAYVAPTDLTRARTDHVFIYVNRRSIRDRFLIRAVMEGYGQRLMKGRYPYAVLFLDVDPAALDVNIHPSKQEVRFRDGRDVFAAVVRAIDEALVQSSSGVLGLWKGVDGRSASAFAAPPSVAEPLPAYPGGGQRSLLLESTEKGETRDRTRGPEIVGQLGDTYILCQGEEGLLVVDQHAAHERILYERLKRSFETAKIESQVFLMPFRLEVPPRDAKRLLDQAQRISELGIVIEPFGGNTLLLRAFPSFLEKADWRLFLQELLPELDGWDKAKEGLPHGALSVMACHGAIRAGQRLTQQEMQSLVEELKDMALPTHCPHGRPVFLRFGYREIEKMFKR